MIEPSPWRTISHDGTAVSTDCASSTRSSAHTHPTVYSPPPPPQPLRLRITRPPRLPPRAWSAAQVLLYWLWRPGEVAAAARVGLRFRLAVGLGVGRVKRCCSDGGIPCLSLSPSFNRGGVWCRAGRVGSLCRMPMPGLVPIDVGHHLRESGDTDCPDGPAKIFVVHVDRPLEFQCQVPISTV